MPTPLLFQFDDSANSPANFVAAEVHSVNIGQARLIVLNNGLFYTENIVIRNATTTNVMDKGIDYFFRGFDPELTALTGHECASAIYFPTYSGDVEVDYQVVGGYQSMNSAIMKEIAQALATLPPADFNQLANAATVFPTDPHQHSFVDDLTNLEKFRLTIDELKQAIINKRSVLHSNQALAEKVQRLLYVIAGMRESIAGFGDLTTKEDKINKKDDLSNPANISNMFYPTTQAVVEYVDSLPGGSSTIAYGPDIVFTENDGNTLVIRDGKVHAAILDKIPFITTGSWDGNTVAPIEFATIEGSGATLDNRGFDFVTNTSGNLVTAYSSKNPLNHDIFYPEIGFLDVGTGITRCYVNFDQPGSGDSYWNGTDTVYMNQVGLTDFAKIVLNPDFPGNGITVTSIPGSPFSGRMLTWNGARGCGWFETVPGAIPVFSSNNFTINFSVIQVAVPQNHTLYTAGSQGLFKIRASNTELEYMSVRTVDYTILGQRYFRVETLFGLDGYENIDSNAEEPGSTVTKTTTFIPIEDILLDKDSKRYRYFIGIAGNDVYVYNPYTGLNVLVATIGDFPAALLNNMQILFGYGFGTRDLSADPVTGNYNPASPIIAALDEFRITEGINTNSSGFDYTYNYPGAPIYTGSSGASTELYNLIRFTMGKGTNTQLSSGKKLLVGFKTANDAQSIYLQFKGMGPSTEISFWHDLSGTLQQYGSTVSVSNGVLANDLGLYFETFNDAIGDNENSKLVLLTRNPTPNKIFVSDNVSATLIDSFPLETFFVTTDQPECTVSLFDSPETPVVPFDAITYPDYILAGPVNQQFRNGRAHLAADNDRFFFDDLTARDIPYNDDGSGPSVKEKLDELNAITDLNNNLRELNIITDLNNVNDELFVEYEDGILLSDQDHIVQRNNLTYKPKSAELPFSTTGLWEVPGNILPIFNKFHNVQIIDASNENIESFPYASRTFNSNWSLPFQFTIVNTDNTLVKEAIAPARDILGGGVGAYNTLVLSHFDQVYGSGNKTFSNEVTGSTTFWEDQHITSGNTDYNIVPGKFNGSAFTADNKSWLSAIVSYSAGYFPKLHSLSEWAIDFWFYRTTSGEDGLFSYMSDAGRGISIGVTSDNTLQLTLYTANSGTAFITTSFGTVPGEQWNHLELSWVNDILRIFLNGISVYVRTPIVVFPSASKVFLGKALVNGNLRYLQGAIDEFRVIDKVIHTTNFTPLTTPYTVENTSTKTSPSIPGIRFTLGNSDGTVSTAIPAVGKHVEFGFLKSGSVLANDVHGNGPSSSDGVFLRVTNSGTHLQIQFDGQMLEADDTDDISTGAVSITQPLNSTWTTDLTLLRGDLFMYWDSRGLVSNQRELVLCTIDGSGVLTEHYRAQGAISEYLFLDGTSFFFKTDDTNANIKLFDLADAGTLLFPATEIQPQVVPGEGTYPFSYWNMSAALDKDKFNKFGILATGVHFNGSGTDIQSDNVNDAIIEVRNKIEGVSSRIANYVKVRQTVLTGPVDANGNADFLRLDSSSPPSVLPKLKSTVLTTPLFLTFGDGFDEYGERNYIVKVDEILSWPSILTSPYTDLLYFEYNPDTGTLTTGKTDQWSVYYQLMPPTGALRVGDYWYPTDHRHCGQVWNGSSWVPTYRLYVGKANLTWTSLTGVPSTTGVLAFAYQGYYRYKTPDTYNGVGINETITVYDNLGMDFSNVMHRIVRVLWEQDYPATDDHGVLVDLALRDQDRSSGGSEAGIGFTVTYEIIRTYLSLSSGGGQSLSFIGPSGVHRAMNGPIHFEVRRGF